MNRATQTSGGSLDDRRRPVRDRRVSGSIVDAPWCTFDDVLRAVADMLGEHHETQIATE